jgi:hypothetical protein
MPSTTTNPPFDAYKGTEPYAFASYAHADAQIVFPELQRLATLGVHIWYDEGIDPGNEWPEEIALALDKAVYFIVFISPRSVSSRNCRNEIHYALNSSKPFLAVHLEDTPLPPGLSLRMGDLQAVMKFRMADESYARKLTLVFESYIQDIQSRRLVLCAHCGKPFDPKRGGQCSYHPDEPVAVSNTGPRHDYADYYQFQCCGAKVFGEVSQDGVDLLPPRSPGCRIGPHTV